MEREIFVRWIGDRLMAITDLAGNVWAFSGQCLKVSEQAAAIERVGELGRRRAIAATV